MTAAPDLAALWRQCQAMAARVFGSTAWLADEVAQAQARHPGAADLVWHAGDLCAPGPRMLAGGPTELVYRSHCRELLDRAAAAEDLRPPTSAEVCLVCCDASLGAPLRAAGAGLYMRHFARAFPAHPQTAANAEELAYHERAHVHEMDEFDRALRRRGMSTGRRLDPKAVECDGVHDGKPAACRFATTLPGVPRPRPPTDVGGKRPRSKREAPTVAPDHQTLF